MKLSPFCGRARTTAERKDMDPERATFKLHSRREGSVHYERKKRETWNGEIILPLLVRNTGDIERVSLLWVPNTLYDGHSVSNPYFIPTGSLTMTTLCSHHISIYLLHSSVKTRKGRGRLFHAVDLNYVKPICTLH